MTIRRVVPNITSNRMEESVAFYSEFLGFRVAMNMGWIVTVVSPSSPTAQISIVSGDPMESSAITITVEVEEVEALYATAISKEFNIVYPLTDEPWGVRRFHVKDPNGVTINVMCHVTQ